MLLLLLGSSVSKVHSTNPNPFEEQEQHRDGNQPVKEYSSGTEMPCESRFPLSSGDKPIVVTF
jgi:hypothetical protein